MHDRVRDGGRGAVDGRLPLGLRLRVSVEEGEAAAQISQLWVSGSSQGCSPAGVCWANGGRAGRAMYAGRCALNLDVYVYMILF